MPYYSPYAPYLILPVFLAGLYFLLENRLAKPWMRWVWWGMCVVILLAAGWYAAQNQYWYDFFKGYYHSGRKILRDPTVLYDENCYGYVNFPLLAYLFVPIANLPKETAGPIFFLIGYVSILPLAYWLVKSANLKGWPRWIILALLAVNGPLDYSVWLGNITHIIMLSILILIWWFKQGREWLAGILLGINGVLKIPLILPAGYFFIRRRWRVVGGGLFVFGLVLGLSLWLVPLSLNSIWLERCILSFAGHPIAAYNNQSAIGFLAREFMPGNLGWEPLNPTLQFKWVSNLTVSLLYVPVLVILFLGGKSSQSSSIFVLEFFIVLVCSLLTSPISWTHYFMLLLIPAAFCMADDTLRSHKIWVNVLLGISLALLTTPIRLTLALFEQTGQQLFLSLHFAGGFLLYLYLLITWVKAWRLSRPRTSVVRFFDE